MEIVTRDSDIAKFEKIYDQKIFLKLLSTEQLFIRTKFLEWINFDLTFLKDQYIDLHQESSK